MAGMAGIAGMAGMTGWTTDCFGGGAETPVMLPNIAKRIRLLLLLLLLLL